MRLNIEIDNNSGFCNGVVRAITTAEDYLSKNGSLFSLGSIVHNSVELERLKSKGLDVLDDISEIHDATVLIRAHGEPPQTYSLAKKNNITIIDCTCPVVLKLQERVKQTWLEIKESNGQIVIFGKRGHAEVNGLVGQTNGEAIVIENISELSKIDKSRPVALFSQTTKDPVEYKEIAQAISSDIPGTRVFNTICGQVAGRHSKLMEFAKSHDVILFVSGKESSNGKILFELCRSVNSNSHWLENSNQIDIKWFKEGDSVGICGATSTPLWQLEDIFVYLREV